LKLLVSYKGERFFLTSEGIFTTSIASIF